MRERSSVENKECFDIYSKFCPNFKGFGGGIQKDDNRIIQFFENDYRYIEFDNPLVYDKEKFISRSLSGSYSLKEGDMAYQEYLDELNRLFEKYAKENVFTMRNKTVVYFGKLK